MQKFTHRHIGPSVKDAQEMLKLLGYESLDSLINDAVPDVIRYKQSLTIPEGTNEHQALKELSSMFSDVPQAQSLIGQGYHNTYVPSAILRNLFENPGWYTSYTPYQSEISQGRLELLFYYQTLVCELTGLDIANASLLDEGTAIAEAVTLAFRKHRERRTKIVTVNALHPQNVQVLNTRCTQIGLELSDDPSLLSEEVIAIVIQRPDTYGAIENFDDVIQNARRLGCLVIIVADPMSLLLMDAPARMGADIVVGSMQRYGVPMGNGGPHAAYMAVDKELARLLPGRLVGQSRDANGRPAYRLTLQTREQHIRREKATSNICTAQALLANMAVAYAIWHGPKGLIAIAQRIHTLTKRFARSLEAGAYKIATQHYFDTLTVRVADAYAIAEKAEKTGLLLRVIDPKNIALSFDETCTQDTLRMLADVFSIPLAQAPTQELANEATKETTKETIRGSEDVANYARDEITDSTGGSMLNYGARGEDFLSQAPFHLNKSETSFMRFLRELVNKDLALDRSMIPLGSCTMKLNAAVEMIPVSWPQIANVHPFAPSKYRKGYMRMLSQLEEWLCEITGFSKVSFQPNSGSQGEYAGLLAIKTYFAQKGETNRKLCLIPESAHGTNPASAQMAGMDIMVVKCDTHGNVSLDDLRNKATEHKERLAALMITYPSTHGVFESDIVDICKLIHDCGGQVYLDGANLNSMVGLARPADIGADVCHMNLHKTFCIPHGGGGPGVGPIGVATHLAEFLPSTGEEIGNTRREKNVHDSSINETKELRIASAPYGSASILPISWMYIRLLGGDGLTEATQYAILNANYLSCLLNEYFPVLYKGNAGLVAHECVLDTRVVRETSGVTVQDIAKRLIDYGFHAPTMSWPVVGTLMLEPTESEPRQELDRFIAALRDIRKEIDLIEQGQWDKSNNPLKNAPHTIETVMSDTYSLPYSRSIASAQTQNYAKYWPPVERIDDVQGDRNLVCSCPPLTSYT